MAGCCLWNLPVLPILILREKTVPQEGKAHRDVMKVSVPAYDANNGVLTWQQVKEELIKVSQPEGEWTTQWSMAYSGESGKVSYWFHCDYDREWEYFIGE